MDTIQRQVTSYRVSLEKVRALRREIQLDEDLDKRIRSTPEGMTRVLVDRGIPIHLALGMAAEDFQDPGFGGALSLWTWDCCCTGCCVTSCIGTNITNSITAREAVSLESLFGTKIRQS
jgi:hypothetical protein